MNALQLLGIFLLCASSSLAAELRVGVAKVDITPDYPVRLNGFAARKSESDGISGRIWAKAMAIADHHEGLAILITTDSLGIPASLTDEIAVRLGKKIGLKPTRLTITATHTHSAPMIRGVANALFGHDLSPEEWDHISRYSLDFTNALESVALAAFRDLKPATLEVATGKVGFAINRRTKGGPVDHDLPILVVRDLERHVRAVWFSYACHCVVLADSKIHGDWAGCAMEEIEKDFPGAIALASIGCGADQNPSERNSVEVASKFGRSLADEVHRLIGPSLRPLSKGPSIQKADIELAYDTPRTRDEWLELMKKGGHTAYYARLNLMRIDHGERLPTHLTYPIQTWRFGEELAVVFLPGEVVVDFGLRLKRELRDLIPIAYANDAPGYIPSERVLKEGGYEGGGAMIYYDRPNRFAPGLEQKIIDAVHAQLPAAFRKDPAVKGTEGTKPLPPGEALRTLKLKPGLAVELALSEPLVESPVAIDWGADGRLWVCEMFDYPTGLEENWKAGGRIKVLTDSDFDGKYDKATIFLDGLPFPTGVTAWKNGALISAAPDIIFAEDTDGDGRADNVEKLFSGFVTDNYQARVNSLSPGLDGWFYGANGLLGGKIRGGSKGEVELGKRDFRFRPDTRDFEPAGGFTQFGRVRDDWGRWFGCENSGPLYHFPLPDHYLIRNPRAAPPGSRIPLATAGGRVFPIVEALPRYNNPESADRFTAACGLGIYRDVLLGNQYRGNAFTCEPAHNLVSRAILDDGPLPQARRAADEMKSEFLASTDVWFRPVQIRTGPDGALYVVDMYRFLIEHPRWIAADRLAKINVRAGATMGRIYRIAPEGAELKRVEDLTKLNPRSLALALASRNGTERDRVQLELLRRKEPATHEPLFRLQIAAVFPEIRAQALCVLDLLGALTPTHLLPSLADDDSHVREQAVRISERFSADPAIAAKVIKLAEDPEDCVRMQVAFSLGEFPSKDAAVALQNLASGPDAANPWFRAAIASSAGRHPVQLPTSVVQSGPKGEDPAMKKLAAQMLTGATANRTPILKKFAAALTLNGEVSHGGEIFAQRCSMCHKLDTAGHDVGPNLAALRDKPVDYWLKNILDPNAIVEPATAGTVLELKNGRMLAGVIKAETATSLTVAAPGSGAETVLRLDVKSRSAAPVSLMPDGLEADLNPQDLADLIAFLRTPPKLGNNPSVITADKEGVVLLPALNAEIRGQTLTFELEFSNLGYWHSTDDHAAWTAHITQPGDYEVCMDAACAPASAGTPFIIRIGAAEIRGAVSATNGWSDYQKIKVGMVNLTAGENRIVIRPGADPQLALMVLKSIILKPVGGTPK